MALHEEFRQYTKEEIAGIKRKVCAKHNCIYFSSLHDANTKAAKDGYTNKVCNYILHTGHMRGCMPDECKHWKEKNVKKKRNKFANDTGYNN